MIKKKERLDSVTKGDGIKQKDTGRNAKDAGKPKENGVKVGGVGRGRGRKRGRGGKG